MSTALIVVDAQKIYTDPKSGMYCKGASDTITRINALIEAFRRRRRPVFLIRHVHKVDGSDLGRMFDFTGEPEEDFNFKEGTREVEFDDALVRPANAVEIVKNRYSAFVGTDLEKRLRLESADTVVVCGFMTNFCCESTARDAHDRDFFVDFVTDATGTPGTDHLGQQEIRKVVSELLGAGYARVAKTKTFLSGFSE